MAAPVSEVRATSLVGRLSVPVKCPVSQQDDRREEDAEEHRGGGQQPRIARDTRRGEPVAVLTPVSSRMLPGR